MYQGYFKRIFDLSFSILLFIVFLPIFPLIIWISYCYTGSPIFTQKRIGSKGKMFNIYKFRSLLIGRESDQKRQYSFGNILRKYGVDELPQLYNIIKNEMSFVGPRPLLSIRNKKNAKIRNNVKPGITGLSQVNGNTLLTLKKKMYFDLKYIQDISLKNDLIIIFKTILIVLCGKKT